MRKLTMLDDMLPHFGHGITDRSIVVKQVAVLTGVPVGEGGKLLRDGVEETHNNTNRGGFHVAAELVHRHRVRDTVVAVELHLFPHGEENRGQEEDGGPVLHLLAAVDTRVQSRELFQDVPLELAPHVSQSTLNLEVDHDRRNGTAVVLGVFVVDLAVKGHLRSLALNHGDVHSQVVGKDQLKGLSDDGHLLLDVVAVGSLEDLSDEGSALEVIINEVFKGTFNVLVEVLRKSIEADALGTNVELLGTSLEVDGVASSNIRLNPLDGEAAVISNEDLANHDGQGKTVAVGDPHEGLFLSKALDIVDRNSTVHVPLIVSLPVLHEVTNVLDVNSRAGNLPETSVRRLAPSTWLSLIASLLKEFASQASAQLSYLAGLLSLLWQKRALSAAHLLLSISSLLLSVRNTSNNWLGCFGNWALANTIASP